MNLKKQATKDKSDIHTLIRRLGILVKALIIIFIFSALNTYSNDAGQMLGDSYVGESELDVPDEENQEQFAFPTNEKKDFEKLENLIVKEEKDDPYIGSKIPELKTRSTALDKSKSFGYTPPGTFDKDPNYLKIENQKVLEGFSNTGKYSGTLSFFKDSYDYLGSGEIFKNIYRRDHSEFAAIVRYSGHRLIGREKYFHFGIGAGAGLGYNRGVGRFLRTGTQSNAKFTLWTIPAELSFLSEFPISKYLKFSAAFGPSVLLLWEHRSDLPQGDYKKDLKQLGRGYFLEGMVKLSMTEFFPEMALDLFNQFRITKSYFTLSARGHNYNHFKDDYIRLKGLSFGLGYTIEYL